MSHQLNCHRARILIIPSSYPPVLGGLQTVTHMLAQQLVRWEYQVRVVTNHYPRSLAAHETLDQVPVRRWLFLTPDLSDLRRGRPDLFLASFYFLPSTLLHLNRLLQTFRPEVVNVHFPDAQILFVLLLRRRFKFRLIVSLHGHDIVRWFPDISFQANNSKYSHLARLRSLLLESDAVTACSRYLLDKATQLEPSVAQKGYVIHNGIETERFKNKTMYRHFRPYILAYGRLTFRKGFDILLDAFGRLAPDFPNVDLILAGTGEEHENLRGQAQRLRLNGRVHFFGRATPEEVVRLLNGCLFVVVPSRWEPFGIVALEAMAAGKPVLATRVGGLSEFLASSTNKLLEPTVVELAKGIAEWLRRSDEVKTMGEENRQLAANHTWSQVVQRYIDVYYAN